MLAKTQDNKGKLVRMRVRWYPPNWSTYESFRFALYMHKLINHDDVPEAASTNSPLIKSLVNLISGTTTICFPSQLPPPLLPIAMRVKSATQPWVG